MFWLICGIISSAMIAIAMKVSEKHISNNVGLIVVNYISCTITAAIYMGRPEGVLESSNFGLSMVLAVLGGLIYIAGFLLLQWNISKNGVVLSSVFVKMGLLVSFLMSIVVFHENPTMLQFIGFAVAIAAILIINLEKGSTKAASALGLICLIFTGGFSDSISKFYEVYGGENLSGIILMVQFATALVFSLMYLKYKHQSIGRMEVVFGLLVGIPNYFCSLFLLKALVTVPAVLVFPTFSVGTFLVISATGLIFFKEKLSIKQVVGCGLIIIALLLLNL